MKRGYHIIGWAAGFLLLVAHGCVQTVEIAPPEERQVFVKCILNAGKELQQATLLYSGGIGEDGFEPVTDATVMVSCVEYEGSCSFHHIGNGVYEGNLVPASELTYVFRAALPGGDTLVAVTRVPGLFYVDSDFSPPEQWIEEGKYDDPDLNPWSLTLWEKARQDIQRWGGRSLSSEMPGMTYWISLTGGRHHVYVHGWMEDSSGVLAPIPQLATNSRLADNVNANGKKYRAVDGAAVSDLDPRRRYEQLICQHYDGLALHDNYLRIEFPVDYDNGLRNIYRLLLSGYAGLDPESYSSMGTEKEATRHFAIVGDFNYNFWGRYDWKKAHPVLYFSSVSDEYDRYLRSVQATLADREGDLLSSLYKETAEYSNVKGGHGVFGAIITLRHDCDMALAPGFAGPYYDSYPAYGGMLPER